MSKRSRLIVLLTAFFALLPLASWAKKVFLNGTEITGMSNRTFQNVSVRIDANGNIHITGKQYKVVTPSQAAKLKKNPKYRPAPVARRPAPRPTARFSANYLMVIQRSSHQASGYRLVIKINGKQIRDVGLNVRQDVIQLNAHLRRGRNNITIESYKQKTSGVQGSIKVILTRGKVKSGRVEIQKPYILEFKRTFIQTKNYRHIFPVRIN